METCFRLSGIAHDSDEPLVFLLFPHESIAKPDQWRIHASWRV